MQQEPLSERARGRWRSILPDLVVSTKALSGTHGPCPMCGGKDRFRFDDKEGRGTWFCNQCGAGDGINLVMKLRGVDFKGAAALIEPLIGTAPRHLPRPARSDDEKRGWMRDLWEGAHPVTPTDPAGLWLSKRAGLSAFPAALRFHDRVATPDGPPGARSYRPAMLAKVTDKDGLPVQLHRTFLTNEGDRAPIARPRAIMPGTMPEGAAVRLSAASDALGIAEGIETALSASMLHDVPCWAALNAGQLAKWHPPAGVQRVFIFGDNDLSGTGQSAAWALYRRLYSEARRHGDETFVVEAPTFPDVIGEDWNDVAIKEGCGVAKVSELS